MYIVKTKGLKYQEHDILIGDTKAQLHAFENEPVRFCYHDCIWATHVALFSTLKVAEGVAELFSGKVVEATAKQRRAGALLAPFVVIVKE